MSLKTRGQQATIRIAVDGIQLQTSGRVIEAFQIDQDSVNTPGQRAAGDEHILWKVKLIGHMLYLVFETEIGTGTVIQTN